MEIDEVKCGLKVKGQGTIPDIDLLEKIYKYDIGSTSAGTYHLIIAKALCYKQLGNIKEGIKIIEYLDGKLNIYKKEADVCPAITNQSAVFSENSSEIYTKPNNSYLISKTKP